LVKAFAYGAGSAEIASLLEYNGLTGSLWHMRMRSGPERNDNLSGNGDES
jgi:hypothetical protein